MVICYQVGICISTLPELRKIDRKTQKLLTIQGEMHSQTGVKDTLYMKSSGDKKELIESRFGAVVRELTFHPCGLGLIPSLTPYMWVEFVVSLL